MTSTEPAAAPYATLAPYFAQLFVPRGIRGWFERASGLVVAGGVRGGWHLDVGAGTCRYSRYWTQAGFRTVGVDVLIEMLRMARLNGIDGQLHRVCGTIDCLRPAARFDLATCIDDVAAYVGAQPGGLERFLGELRLRLRPGGLFLFDFITPAGQRRYNFRNTRQIREGRITADSRGRFDEARQLLTVELTLEAPGRVERERHLLRLYTTEEMEGLLRQAGFEVLAMTDLYDGNGVGYRANQPSYDVLARRL
jgi:SAM-dependent methyltransferase